MNKLFAPVLAVMTIASSMPVMAAENSLSFNAAATSDYRFRGVSQTRLDPAVQAGVDYVHGDSGFYVGSWASNIKWVKDAGGDTDIEIDAYAGLRGNFNEGMTYDLGVISYFYPDNKLDEVAGYDNGDTTEIYGQIAYGPAYLKYSHALTPLFGFMDSENSNYIDLGANIALTEKLTLNLHAGHQEVKNNLLAKYDDWKIGLTHDFGYLAVSIAGIGTNAEKVAYTSARNGKFLGKDSAVITLSKVF